MPFIKLDPEAMRRAFESDDPTEAIKQIIREAEGEQRDTIEEVIQDIDEGPNYFSYEIN
jgi:hypothetical protein